MCDGLLHLAFIRHMQYGSASTGRTESGVRNCRSLTDQMRREENLQRLQHLTSISTFHYNIQNTPYLSQVTLISISECGAFTFLICLSERQIEMKVQYKKGNYAEDMFLLLINVSK